MSQISHQSGSLLATGTMMKVLITGATGFIGSHLAARLLREGSIVHAVIRSKSAVPTWWGNLAKAITLHHHDGSTEGLTDIVSEAKPDLVYHCATYFVAEHVPQDIDAMAKSNLLFGMQLLEAMVSSSVRSLVNIGTAWQHRRGPGYHPVSLYAATKQAFEAIVDYYVDAHTFGVITLKLYDSYGPHDQRKKLIPLLMELVDFPREVKMSPGSQLIDLVFVDDITEALIIAGRRLLASGGAHERFAVRTGHSVSLRNVVEAFERIADRKLPLLWGSKPYRIREVMTPWDGDILPNWAASVQLEEGLRRTLQAHRERRRPA